MSKLTGKLFGRVRSATNRLSRSPSPTPSKSSSLGSAKQPSPSPAPSSTAAEFDKMLFNLLMNIIEFADQVIYPELSQHGPVIADLYAMVSELPAFKEDTYVGLSALGQVTDRISPQPSKSNSVKPSTLFRRVSERFAPSPSSPTNKDLLFHGLNNIVVHASQFDLFPEFTRDYGSFTGDLCTVLKEFPTREEDVYSSIPKIKDALSAIAGTLPLRVMELCDLDPSKPLPPATRMYLNDGTSVPVEQIRSHRYMQHEINERGHPYDGVIESISGTILSIEKGRRQGGHPMDVYFTAPEAEVMMHANVPVSSTQKARVQVMHYMEGEKVMPVTPGYEKKKVAYGQNEFFKECKGDIDALHAEPPKRFPFELDQAGMLIHESVGVEPEPEPMEVEEDTPYFFDEIHAAARPYSHIADSGCYAPEDEGYGYPTPAASQDPEPASRASPASPCNNVGASPASVLRPAKAKKRKIRKSEKAALRELRAMKKSAKKDYKRVKKLQRKMKEVYNQIKAEEKEAKEAIEAIDWGSDDDNSGDGGDGGGEEERRRRAEVREGKKRETPSDSAEDEPSTSTARRFAFALPIDPGSSTSSQIPRQPTCVWDRDGILISGGCYVGETVDPAKWKLRRVPLDPAPVPPPAPQPALHANADPASQNSAGPSQPSATPGHAPSNPQVHSRPSRAGEDGAGSSSQPRTSSQLSPASTNDTPSSETEELLEYTDAPPSPRPLTRQPAYIWDRDGNIIAGGALLTREEINELIAGCLPPRPTPVPPPAPQPAPHANATSASQNGAGPSQSSSETPRGFAPGPQVHSRPSRAGEDGVGSSSQPSDSTQPTQPASAFAPPSASQPFLRANSAAEHSQPSSSSAPRRGIPRAPTCIWDRETRDIIHGDPKMALDVKLMREFNSSWPILRHRSPSPAPDVPSSPVPSSSGQFKGKKRSLWFEDEGDTVNDSCDNGDAMVRVSPSTSSQDNEGSQRKVKKRARISAEQDDDAVAAPTPSSSHAGSSSKRTRKGKKRSIPVTDNVDDTAAGSASGGGPAAVPATSSSSKAEKAQRKKKKHSKTSTEQVDAAATKSSTHDSWKQASAEGPATIGKKRSREEGDQDDEDQSPSQRRKL